MSRDEDQVVRNLLKGAGLISFGLVLEVTISFLAQVLAANFLSIDNFGAVTVGSSLITVGAFLTSLGFGEGLTRHLPRHTRSERRFLSLFALIVGGFVAVAVSAVLVLKAEFVAAEVFNDPTVVPSIRVFGAGIPFATVSMIAIGGIRGQQRSTARVLIENILRPVSRFGFVIVAVILGLSQAGFAGAYTVPYVLAALLAGYLFVRELSTGDDGKLVRSEHLRVIRKFTKYSIPFTITSGASFIYQSADIFIILYISSSYNVGIYGVAYTVGKLVLIFSAAFNYLGVPITSELEANERFDEMITMNQSIIRWLTVASIPVIVPFVLFPAEFITAVYRPEYAQGAGVLALLAAGFAISNPLSAQGNVLRAIGASKAIAANNIIAAVVNVALNFWLIPRFGIEGAAVATVASYLLRDGLVTVETWVFTDRLLVTREVIYMSALSLPLFAVAALLSQGVQMTFPLVLVVSAVFAAIYILCVLAIFGLNQTEVMLLRSAQEQYHIDVLPVEYVIKRFS